MKPIADLDNEPIRRHDHSTPELPGATDLGNPPRRNVGQVDGRSPAGRGDSWSNLPTPASDGDIRPPSLRSRVTDDINGKPTAANLRRWHEYAARSSPRCDD
jgi:hypothetical protein